MILHILPELRGYVLNYRTGTVCPGCSGSNWLLGRFSAECAYCGTALPFAPPERTAADVTYPAWAGRA